MNTQNSTMRYNTASIALHWLMLVLFVAVYACMELKGFFPRGSDTREALKAWHFMLGMLIFALVWPRIASRLMSRASAIEPEPSKWEATSAKLAHLALYAFMIVMPLLGWLLLSAAGKPIPFFGLELPALLEKNKETADVLKEVHETLGNAGYFLIALHAAAALYHHYIKRDNTLIRMLIKK